MHNESSAVVTDAEISIALLAAMKDHLTFNSVQLQKYSIQGPLFELARARLQQQYPDGSPELITLQKNAVLFVSGKAASLCGSACTAIKDIDTALVLEVITRAPN